MFQSMVDVGIFVPYSVHLLHVFDTVFISLSSLLFLIIILLLYIFVIPYHLLRSFAYPITCHMPD